MPIVILAGGEGQRMGGVDKCLLPLGTETLLARLIRIFRPQSAMILLNANGNASRFSAYNLSVIADQYPAGVGPLGGLVSTMHYLHSQQAQWSSQGASNWLLSVAGDCPFLPGNLLEVLLAATSSGDNEVIYAHSEGRDHFVIALWSLTLLRPMENFLAGGQRSVGKFIHSRKSKAVGFESRHIDPFFNINTNEHYVLAQNLLSQPWPTIP